MLSSIIFTTDEEKHISAMLHFDIEKSLHRSLNILQHTKNQHFAT